MNYNLCCIVSIFHLSYSNYYFICRVLRVHLGHLETKVTLDLL